MKIFSDVRMNLLGLILCSMALGFSIERGQGLFVIMNLSLIVLNSIIVLPRIKS